MCFANVTGKVICDSKVGGGGHNLLFTISHSSEKRLNPEENLRFAEQDNGDEKWKWKLLCLRQGIKGLGKNWRI